MPQLDGANTSFAVDGNADWTDAMFFGAPGYGPPVMMTGCSLTAGSNIVTLQTTVGLQPGMQIAGTPGLPSCYIVSIPSTTTITTGDIYGNPVNAVATTVETNLSFNPRPLDLTGISFIAHLRAEPGATQVFLTAKTTDGTLMQYGSSGVLAFNVPAVKMGGVPPRTYVMDLLAIADGRVINLIPNQPCNVTVNPGISDSALL
jgi:hypothetical protein